MVSNQAVKTVCHNNHWCEPVWMLFVFDDITSYSCSPAALPLFSGGKKVFVDFFYHARVVALSAAALSCFNRDSSIVDTYVWKPAFHERWFDRSKQYRIYTETVNLKVKPYRRHTAEQREGLVCGTIVQGRMDCIGVVCNKKIHTVLAHRVLW